MTRNELVATLHSLKGELKQQFGIEQIALFGSYARDEVHEDSDVDIAILEMNLKIGFYIINAKNYLQRSVDIGTFKSMKTFIKNRIKKDFIYV